MQSARTQASAIPNGLIAHETVLALDPEVLHTQAEASVRALLKEGESANTARSYASALRYWAAPGAPALNTVLHRLSVLSKAYQMRDVPNPTRDAGVQELVRRIRRAYAARGVRPAAKSLLVASSQQYGSAVSPKSSVPVSSRPLPVRPLSAWIAQS